MAAKGQRIADIADGLEATAGAAHDDRAVAKDAAEQRLVDIDAFGGPSRSCAVTAGRICR